MNDRKSDRRPDPLSSPFDQARDELFSHILRCGVLEAALDQQGEWFDDTMEYLGDRYQDLSDDDLAALRRLGEHYCRPVIKRSQSQEAHGETIGAAG